MTYIKLEDLQKFPIRQNHYDKENGNEHFICGIETVIEYAENLPTVDVVEAKHAEWVKTPYRPPYCSCCDEDVPLHRDGENNYKSNYCPHCGAKMDGGK